MTEHDIEHAVLAALYTVAPEAEDDKLDPGTNFRDQLDIDSMDFLNFLVALKDALGVEVPEADYAQVSTLRDCISYFSRRLPKT